MTSNVTLINLFALLTAALPKNVSLSAVQIVLVHGTDHIYCMCFQMAVSAVTVRFNYILHVLGCICVCEKGSIVCPDMSWPEEVLTNW